MRYADAAATIIVAGGTILSLAALPAAAAPAAAERPEAVGRPAGEGDRPALDESDRASLVRQVYAAYARRSAAGGGEAVDFTLDDFRTVGGERFAEVALFPDLVTPAGGWELAAVVEVRREEGDPERRIAFRPAWRQVEEPTPEGLLGRPASETLGPLGSHFTSRRRIDAATTYRVRVFHDGLERTYRAAALWMVDSDGTRAFGLADHVVPDVAMATDDGVGPGSLLADTHSVDDPALARWAIDEGVCEPVRTVRRTGQPGSVDGALSAPSPDGDRPSFVTVHACTCATDCSQRCEAVTEATYDGCRAVLAGHARDVPRRAVAVIYEVDQSSPPGVPAACTAGLTCEIVECPDGLCGAARVRLEVEDGELRLDTWAGTNGGAGHGQRHVCGRCDPIERMR